MEQTSPFAPESRDADDQSPEIAFTPVPRLRQRRNGWSEHRQRLFIAALATRRPSRARTCARVQCDF